MNRKQRVVAPVKMSHKRITPLSLVFVFVGMMFLVPIITGEALGTTVAQVHNGIQVATSIVWEHLDAGNYVVKPCCDSYGQCYWTTIGHILSEEMKKDGS
ncbi:MAG TPA: hypothetical protein VEH06_15885 [Candidatus Bathyarchaeia archaeon]|nr:hypothetical protein [Candidatus Bathyarchaeia archaeon]